MRQSKCYVAAACAATADFHFPSIVSCVVLLLTSSSSIVHCPAKTCVQHFCDFTRVLYKKFLLLFE